MSKNNLLTIDQIVDSLDDTPESVEVAIWHFQYTLFKNDNEKVLDKLQQIKHETDNEITLALIGGYEALNNYYNIKRGEDEGSEELFQDSHNKNFKRLKLIWEEQENKIDDLTIIILKNQAALSIRNADDFLTADIIFHDVYESEKKLIGETQNSSDPDNRLRHYLCHEWIGYTAFNWARNPKFNHANEERMQLYQDSIESMRKASKFGKRFYDNPKNVASQVEKRNIDYIIQFFSQIHDEMETEQLIPYLKRELNRMGIVTQGQNNHLRRDYHCYTLQIHELLETSNLVSPFNWKYHAQQAKQINESMSSGTELGHKHKDLVEKYLSN